MQFKFDTNTIQIWYKYNANLIQIQFKFDTNTIKVMKILFASCALINLAESDGTKDPKVTGSAFQINCRLE